MDPQLKKNLSSSHSWFRVIYVVIFVVAAEIAATLALIIAFVQVLFSLITGQANDRLTRFGDSLAKFLYASYLFIMYKSEEKPFPFADWPEGAGNEIVAESEVISEGEVIENNVEESSPKDEPEQETARKEEKSDPADADADADADATSKSDKDDSPKSKKS